MKKGGKKPNEEFDELWDKAEKIDVEVSPRAERMSVFSMKIDRDLLEALVEAARMKGIGPSTLARELIEEGLMARGERVPTENILEILSRRVEDLKKARGARDTGRAS